jgi:FkbM family methyltransferase
MRHPEAIVLSADGVQARGFHGKNAFADQFNIMRGNPKVIFDIGANIGQTAERYLEIFHDATIYCFEPFPPSYERLRQRFFGHPRVRCYPLAISETAGARPFHVFTNSVTNSLLPASKHVYDFVASGEMDPAGVIDVNSTTVDEFCRRESIGHIDILKLDIQGGKAEALRGATRTLSQHSVNLIYTELLFVAVYDRQGHFYEIARFLNLHNYRLFDFYNFAYGVNGQLKWGDAIFLKTK